MKKTSIVLCIICLGLVLLLSGCTEDSDSETNESNGGSTTGNIITMTAKELQYDMSLDTDGATYFKMLYNSLKEGDILVLQDSISQISYNSDEGVTKISFNITTEGEAGYTLVNYYFEGDITESYQIDDEVKITETIKHVEFTYESAIGSMNYELELFDGQWESEEYFVNNLASIFGGFKPLTQSCIEKI